MTCTLGCENNDLVCVGGYHQGSVHVALDNPFESHNYVLIERLAGVSSYTCEARLGSGLALGAPECGWHTAAPQLRWRSRRHASSCWKQCALALASTRGGGGLEMREPRLMRAGSLGLDWRASIDATQDRPHSWAQR